jgi:hypothetical protein
MQCALDSKAKVEQAVLIVERWLLGRLRHRIFHSLAEVNAAISDLMHEPKTGSCPSPVVSVGFFSTAGCVMR